MSSIDRTERAAPVTGAERHSLRARDSSGRAGAASRRSAYSLLTELKERNISFTPTLSAYPHYAPSAVPFMEKTVHRAAELNVQLVVGTDYPSSYGEKCGDDIYKEMNLLEDNGVSRLEVLRGATHYAAEKIGKENEIGLIGKGYRANLVFYEGPIDTGRLTSSRISGTMLNGDMIIEKGMLVKEYSSYFKTKTSMVFPYGFYDAVSEVNIGISYTNFDLLNSGISIYSDAGWSTRNMWSINLQLFLPSPINWRRSLPRLNGRSTPS